MLIDVTDRTQAESETRRTADLLNAIVEATPDAMFVKDLQGKYLLFNPAASAFVGLKIEDVIGRDDHALFSPASAELVMLRDRQVIESGQIETIEEELSASGTIRTFLATKAPYRDSSGNIVGVIGISRDITERKQAELQLAEANHRFEETLEAVSDLFAAFDLNWNYTYINSKAAAFTGNRPWEMLGRNIWELFPSAVGGEFYRELHQAIATQLIRTFESFYPDLNRTYEHRAYQTWRQSHD